MQIRNLLILLIVCCLACNNTQEEKPGKLTSETNSDVPFNKTKWATKDGGDYPYRDKMLKDLMTNYSLHGLREDTLEKLLGSPDRTNNGYLYYTIAQKRLGFFPLHTKTLVFKLTKDSTVEWRKIHE